MSRPAYAFLLFVAFLTLLLCAATLHDTQAIYLAQHTDNQTISTLRAQVVDLKRDLTDTEHALDKAALDGSRLSEENEVLKARAAIAERALERRTKL